MNKDEITDKDRLDFLERWMFQERYESVGIGFGNTYDGNYPLWISLEVDHKDKEIYGTCVRDCIDKFIIAIQEKKSEQIGINKPGENK